MQALMDAPVVSFDTEFDGDTPPAFAQWYGFSLACLDPDDPEQVIAHYWSFKGHNRVDPKNAINNVLKPILHNEDKIIVVHNASAELGVLKPRNIAYPKNLSDTMIKAFLWDENNLKGLKEQAKLFLGAKGALTYKQTQDELKKFDKKAKDVIKKMTKAAWEWYRDNRKTSDEANPPDTEIMDDWPSWKRVTHRLPPKMLKKDVVEYVRDRFEQRILTHYSKKKDERFAEYATDDAVYTILLHHLYDKLFTEFKEATGCDLQRAHDELELPMMFIVTDMQHYGLQVDLDAVKRIRKVLLGFKAKLEKQFVKWFGEDFNPNSSAQVAELFWEKMELKPPHWLKASEKTGKYGCPGDVLEWLSDKKHVTPAKALKRYRNVCKMLGTYAEAILNQERNGRIYTSFNPVGADTGRWTSGGGKGKNKKISVQTIPKPHVLPQRWAPDDWEPEPEDKPTNIPEEYVYAGKDKKSGRYKWRPESFRRVFIPTPGYDLISYDLSQIELRLMAHFSKDKALLKAYQQWDCAECGASGRTQVVLHECPNCGAAPGKRDKLDPEQPPINGFCLGMDIHALTCVLTPLYERYGMERGRDLAKPVNFGLLYGKQHKSLAKELGVPEAEGKVIYDGYFKAYPGVKRYHQWVEYRIKKKGWFEMLSGRRRRFFKDVNKLRHGKIDSYQFEKVIRTAYNCIIQGSAGDIMKLGMRNLYREMQEKPDTIGLARYLLQVHDETMLEAPQEVSHQVGDRLKYHLENSCKIRVPILSEGTVGAPSWEEAH